MTERHLVAWLPTLSALLGVVAMRLLDAPMPWRLAAQLASLVLVWRVVVGRYGAYSPAAFYLPVSGLYVLAAVFEVAVFGNRLELDARLMADLADVGIGFLVCVALGHEASAPPRRAVRAHSPAAARGTGRAMLLICSLLFAASVGMTLQRYGLDIGGLSRAELYADEHVALSLVRGMLALGLGIAAASVVAEEHARRESLVTERRWLLALLAAYALVDLAVLGDRRLPVTSALAVLVALSPRRVPATRGALAVGAVVVLVLYGFVRNTPPGEWLSIITSGDVLGGLSPAANEFGGLAIIGGAIGDFATLPKDYPTYVDAFLQVMPRALVPNRPESPTEWFMWSYFPALAEIGASFAFNGIVEALANGGLPGVVLAGLTTGALIGLVGRWRVRGAALGAPVSAYIFTFSMRMDFASILRTALVSAMACALLLAGAAAARRLAPMRRPGGPVKDQIA